MKGSKRRYLLRLAIVFATYFITARVGLSINAVSGFAAAVWPPTGIALAATYIFGYRMWPGVILAAFLVNHITGAPLLVASGIAIGNTVEALAGAYLLKRFIKFDTALERIKDVLGLVLFAALLSTCISATIGVASLLLGKVIVFSSAGTTWTTWWVGDMLGVLVAAPLIFVWSNKSSINFSVKRIAETLIVTFLLLEISGIVFRGLLQNDIKPITFGYILFPILIWVVLRYGQRGGVSSLFGMSVVAIWSTVSGSATVSSRALSDNLLLLQTFTGVTAVTFMTMAAAVAERERTLKHQQRLEQKTIFLVKQRSRLQALSASKDEFIALASHQLRTPATSVKQYTSMLLDEYAGKLNKNQRKLLSVANESNERQLQVIDSLLRTAQVDAGIVLNNERTNLNLMIGEILKDQSSIFESKNQVVDFTRATGQPIVLIDVAKFRMVLENIFDNASKYSSYGGKIKVAIKRNKNNLQVTVKDYGVGIKKRDLPKLFKKFSRIDNPLSITVGGTGLGLYWAKKLIDAQGGSIVATSELGRGSTFIITLPASLKS